MRYFLLFSEVSNTFIKYLVLEMTTSDKSLVSKMSSKLKFLIPSVWVRWQHGDDFKTLFPH